MHNFTCHPACLRSPARTTALPGDYNSPSFSLRLPGLVRERARAPGKLVTSPQMAFSLRQTAWAAFVAAVVLLVVIAVAAYRTTSLLVNSERAVAHTHEVQTHLEDLRADIIGAEYSRRGYAITNDEQLLKDYRTGVDDIPVEMQLLRQLTADNPDRKLQLDHLQALIDRGVLLQRGAVESRRSGASDVQQEIETTRQTAELASRANALIVSIEHEEGRLLAERRAVSDNLYTHTRRLLIIAFIFALVLLGAEFSLLNLEFTRHERTGRIAHQNRELVNAFFSSSTVGFAILDDQLRYHRINDVLARMAQSEPQALVGQPVNRILGSLVAEVVIHDVLRTGQPVLDREVSTEIPANHSDSRCWLLNYFPIRDNQGRVTQVGVIAVDVTERRRAEDAIRQLSARLINMQDQERRRIARELHDSLGQYLAGLKISIDMLRTSAQQNKTSLLAECSELLDRCITETRTISHLLHPPLLDEAGFSSAASWYVTGFSQRSGIPVALDLPANLPRLPNPVEIALFRVLQEGLTNVHRHSESKSAEIRVRADADQIMLEVIDHGRGIQEHLVRQMQKDGTQAGVGLAGMRERVRELGGRLSIRSDSGGTSIRITIPLAKRSELVDAAAIGDSGSAA